MCACIRPSCMWSIRIRSSCGRQAAEFVQIPAEAIRRVRGFPFRVEPRRPGRPSPREPLVFARAVARPAREAAKPKKIWSLFSVGNSRRRRAGTGEICRERSRREINLPGRLREFAGRGRHGTLSRSASRIPPGFRGKQTSRRVGKIPSSAGPEHSGNGRCGESRHS